MIESAPHAARNAALTFVIVNVALTFVIINAGVVEMDNVFTIGSSRVQMQIPQHLVSIVVISSFGVKLSEMKVCGHWTTDDVLKRR
jgi:hypothetical protein